MRKNPLLYILGVYVAVQLIYVVFFPLPFTSDSLRYLNLAQDCIDRASLYPASHNLYDSYINAPVYVNFLILILSVYNSPSSILLSNIVLNLIQLFFLYKISLRLLGDQRYAAITSLIYIFYLTNLGAVLMNYTEFLFGVLILGSYYFSLGKKNPHYVVSGVLLGFAIGVKQIGVTLYLGHLSLYLFGLIQRNADQRKMALLSLGAVGTVLCVGFFTKHNLGHFVVTSTTGPVNIIMGANDDATGTYNAAVFKKGKMGHIEQEESKTYIEKGEFWKSQSLKWVKENPFKWILLFPRKLFFTFVWDDWSVFTLLNSNQWNLYVIGKLAIKEKRPEEIFRGERMTFVAGFILLYVVHHLSYYLMLFLFFYQFYHYWKNNRRHLLRKFSAIYLFSFWGMAATLMGVGLSRYKYPYVILLMTTIAPLLFDIVKGKGTRL